MSMIEVVLSALVSNFRFAPSEKDILWQMTIIATPTAKGTLGGAKLPMKVAPL
jgi:hypothetical protein